ncbi:MAG: putative synthase protein [Marmoricola sp.]|nr:putative synthase protein [Marmoricola sp.]
MTTTARPAPGQPRVRTPRVLLVAAVCVVTAVVLTSVVGFVGVGSAAGLGALVGGAIAAGFFLFGSVVVNAATRIAPQAALMMALMTYTFQVTLVLLVFLAVSRSGAIGTTLSSGWLAGGVVAATVAWTVGQLVASARARIPVYDIELPGPAGSSAEASSRTREVGAP